MANIHLRSICVSTGKQPLRFRRLNRVLNLESLILSVFVGASEDGSKVFFVTKTELTAGAVKAKTSQPELYECEVVEVEEGGGHEPEVQADARLAGDRREAEGDVASWPRSPPMVRPCISTPRAQIDL